MNIVEATTTAVSGIALGAVGLALGQAELVALPDNAPAWLAGAGSIIGPGFTMWYAWYVTVKIIPRMLEEFRAEAKEQRALHAADMQRLIAAIDRKSP